MLDAIESRFSTQYKVPPATTVGKVNSVPVVTARPIVTGVAGTILDPIIPGVTGTVPAMPILPVESPVKAPQIPIETPIALSGSPAPVVPSTSITTPSPSGVLSDGSAGVQVTSGVAGSHDAVGVNSNLFDSLAAIGATDSTTSASGSPISTPATEPDNTGMGTFFLIGAAIVAAWIIFK